MRKTIIVFVALFLTGTSLIAARDDEPRRLAIREVFAKRAFIGTGLTDITPELREFFGAPRDAGVLVASVTNNGPAAKAGLRVGDVITAVDGNRVETAFDIGQALRGKQAGDAIRIDVVRNKAKQTLMATAEQRELRELPGAFELPDFAPAFRKLDGAEWKALVATPDNDDLRARIRDLEKRLADLEKKMQQK